MPMVTTRTVKTLLTFKTRLSWYSFGPPWRFVSYVLALSFSTSSVQFTQPQVCTSLHELTVFNLSFFRLQHRLAAGRYIFCLQILRYACELCVPCTYSDMQIFTAQSGNCLFSVSPILICWVSWYDQPLGSFWKCCCDTSWITIRCRNSEKKPTLGSRNCFHLHHSNHFPIYFHVTNKAAQISFSTRFYCHVPKLFSHTI